jgi:cytoskeleton protein RodZ
MADLREGTGGAAPATPGRVLAAARQARGMTVTEVALRLKFSPRQIEALEADRYEELPAPTIARGMIRGYAKVLAIAAEPLIEALPRELRAGPVTVRPRDMQVPFPRQSRRGSLLYLLLSGVVLAMVGGVVVEWVLRPGESRVAPATPRPPARAAVPESAPAPAPERPTAAQPATPVSVVETKPADPMRETVLRAKRIELVFEGESWVEIRDADGRVVFSQLNPPGTTRKVEGAAPFSVVIGNAAGVKLRYNDTDVDLAPFTRTDVARLTLK